MSAFEILVLGLLGLVVVLLIWLHARLTDVDTGLVYMLGRAWSKAEDEHEQALSTTHEHHAELLAQLTQLEARLAQFQRRAEWVAATEPAPQPTTSPPGPKKPEPIKRFRRIEME